MMKTSNQEWFQAEPQEWSAITDLGWAVFIHTKENYKKGSFGGKIFMFINVCFHLKGPLREFVPCISLLAVLKPGLRRSTGTQAITLTQTKLFIRETSVILWWAAEKQQRIHSAVNIILLKRTVIRLPLGFFLASEKRVFGLNLKSPSSIMVSVIKSNILNSKLAKERKLERKKRAHA